MTKKIEIKGKTKEAYDHVGAEYDSWYWTEGSVRLRKGLKDRVLSTVNEVLKKKKKPKILDVCCGTGYLVEDLSKLGDYTGADFSTVMVEVCKRRYPKNRFIMGDAENLPFKKDSFDVIVCFWSFHHIIYPEKALNEFSRVLKKNGVLIIATFKDIRLNPLAKLGDIISSGYYGFQTCRYSKKEMENLLAKRFKSFEIEISPKSRLSLSFWNQMGIRFLIAKAIK